MREIKFRAWDEVNKKYWYLENNDFIIEGDGVSIFSEFSSDRINKSWELEQFSGLLDKNGKEIYEGDIIKTEWNGIEQIAVIQFTRASFNAKYICSSRPDFTHYTPGQGINALWWGSFSEVVGNVHENPELLEA
jgi:uncharacterized phage protein (TIGR01671 family)